ncbi:MspA family porin [Nocardia vaccinii]|uniref:MspA family porin n=1 Tax=Nocardia vaccinii TaxID=1822 RepID=UPI000A813BBE|nr:MspA family porin [Nocardia vaccinii]
MRIPLWVAVVLTAATFCTSPACADTPKAPAPHELKAKNGDGRRILLGQRGEAIQHVTGGPVTTREARVTNEAYAVLGGSSASRLRKGTLAIGYKVGCAIATGPVVLEMQGMFSALGVNPVLGDSSTVQITPNDQGTSDTVATLYPGIAITPSITMSFITGTITDVPLASVPVRDGRARVGVRLSDVKVTGCLGPAAIRSYSVLTTESALSNDTVVVYGDAVRI